MLRKRAARGEATPALDRRPEIATEWADVWNAFAHLHGMRTVGMMSENPISAADIEAYLRVHGVEDVELRQEWFGVIAALDRGYFEGKDGDTPRSD